MKHEIEVVAFDGRCYKKREYAIVPGDRAADLFQKTVTKYKNKDSQYLITHRVIDDNENYLLVNVFHHDAK